MLDLIFAHRAILQYSVIALLALACWVWGAGPERACASILLAMPFGEVVYHLLLGPETTVSHTDLGHAILEIAFTVPFLAVALAANRTYPLWLVSFQMVAVLIHLVRNLVPEVHGAAYMAMTIGPSYAMLVTLLLGLLAHCRRRRIHGTYRSWRPFWRRSSTRGPGSSHAS
jgi:hypothetical protein